MKFSEKNVIKALRALGYSRPETSRFTVTYQATGPSTYLLKYPDATSARLIAIKFDISGADQIIEEKTGCSMPWSIAQTGTVFYTKQTKPSKEEQELVEWWMCQAYAKYTGAQWNYGNLTDTMKAQLINYIRYRANMAYFVTLLDRGSIEGEGMSVADIQDHEAAYLMYALSVPSNWAALFPWNLMSNPFSYAPNAAGWNGIMPDEAFSANRVCAGLTRKVQLHKIVEQVPQVMDDRILFFDWRSDPTVFQMPRLLRNINKVRLQDVLEISVGVSS